MSNQSPTGAASGCFPMRVFIGALASVVLLQVAHPWTCVADHPADRRGRMAERSSNHAAARQIAPPYDAAVVGPEYQRPAGPRPPNSVMQFGTPVPWEVLAQGEYIGPSRLPHVPKYRVRVDDVIEFIFRLTGKVTGAAYRLNVGDVLDFESLTATEPTRQVIIQPDGTITLRYLGQVRAEGRTVDALRQELEERYKRLINDPNILVTR